MRKASEFFKHSCTYDSSATSRCTAEIGADVSPFVSCQMCKSNTQLCVPECQRPQDQSIVSVWGAPRSPHGTNTNLTFCRHDRYTPKTRTDSYTPSSTPSGSAMEPRVQHGAQCYRTHLSRCGGHRGPRACAHDLARAAKAPRADSQELQTLCSASALLAIHSQGGALAGPAWNPSGTVQAYALVRRSRSKSSRPIRTRRRPRSGAVIMVARAVADEQEGCSGCSARTWTALAGHQQQWERLLWCRGTAWRGSDA